MTLWTKQFNLKSREISRNEKSPQGKNFPKTNSIFLHLEIAISTFARAEKDLKVNEDTYR